jgi:calmodulin
MVGEACVCKWRLVGIAVRAGCFAVQNNSDIAFRCVVWTFFRWQAHRLSEQEESEIRECFALFDRDKDGKIKIEELGLIMRSLGRAPTGLNFFDGTIIWSASASFLNCTISSDSELEVKEYQKQVDKGDGNFTIDGLMTVMISSWKSLEEEEEAILSAFRVFDKENTGRIDADELRHIFVTLGDALTQEEVN